jgi:ribosomal protein S12 methylthiotransferase accessory factor
MEELAHTRRYSQQIKMRMPRLVTDSEFSNVIDQLDHLNLYSDHGNELLAEFIFSSSQRKEFGMIENHSTSDPTQDLHEIVKRIKSIGHRIILSDLTTPDVRDLGLMVVRAVIPGFHPLFMGHAVRALGGARLWEVPQKLGYTGITRATGDNPAPHPYP